MQFSSILTSLPVELINFNGSQIQNGIKISWETESEVNNNLFSLEKSEDGLIFFEVESVYSKGNSNNKQFYCINDNDIGSEINYYRLKQVDLDGTQTLSKLITVRFIEDNDPPILYPNPSQTGNISIENLILNSDEITIIVSDILGKNFTQKKSQNENKLNLNLTDLIEGNYLVTVKDGKTITTFKLIKLKTAK